MENLPKKTMLDNFFMLFFGIICIIIFILFSYEVYLTKTVAIMILIIDIYATIKYRKNIMLFIVFFMILYFDYSVIITKYLFYTEDFGSLYAQIINHDTMYIGILSLLIMHFVTMITLNISFKKKHSDQILQEQKNVEKNKLRNTIAIIMIILLAIIVIDNKIFNIFNINNRITEYAIILFIFSFYYFRDNKKIRFVLFLIMVLDVFVSIKNGERVGILQIILAYAFICYEKKINCKKILILFAVGIILFTVFGLYGDALEAGYSYVESFENLTADKVINTFLNRKLSLDTSYSAYFTGLTFIDLVDHVSGFDERINNFVEYFTKYTFLGNGSGYQELPKISREYYVHYYGGYINTYFYYWLKWYGVALIGIVFGEYLKVLKKNANNNTFFKLFSIYIVSTLPRMYLYNPTPMFRGLIIFIIVYVIMYGLPIGKNKKERRF